MLQSHWNIRIIFCPVCVEMDDACHFRFLYFFRATLLWYRRRRKKVGDAYESAHTLRGTMASLLQYSHKNRYSQKPLKILPKHSQGH